MAVAKKNQKRQALDELARSGQIEHTFLFVGFELVFVSGAGFIVHINRLSHGDFFGETALLTNERRNASILAVTRVAVMCLQRAQFDEVLGSNKLKVIPIKIQTADQNVFRYSIDA